MLDHIHASVLGGAHQSRTAVLVLDINIRAGVQKHIDHVPITMRHSEHQSGLAVLRIGG